MSRATGLVVVLSRERLAEFENRDDPDSFAEPVPEFTHSRNLPLVCFITDASGRLTHLAMGKQGRRAGTNLRRINLHSIFRLSTRLTVKRIGELVQTRVRGTVLEKFTSGGLLPAKSFESTIDVISQAAPETAQILSEYSEARLVRIAELPRQTRKALGEQKEAVATALTIAGIQRDELRGWDLSEGGAAPTSYLDGLQQVRLREDAMVIDDLATFPGHELVKKFHASSVVFENSQSRLSVTLANKLPLEELTGTDLIYFNETFNCFLMVQYKAMEESRGEHIFRFPDSQLDLEIKRMDRIYAELRKCAPNSEADGYRLSENPFFLKICPRIEFSPDNTGLTKGMYLPLDYWRLLETHPSLIGPKGGKSVSYTTARRYLDNSQFVTIAAGGWVGTTITQSSVLKEAIRSTLESGRAAVIAVNQVLDTRHRRRD